MRRIHWISRSVVTAALLTCTMEAAAQDVLQTGRAHGVDAPHWVREALRTDPHAFEFQRAWLQKVQRIRQRRLLLERGGTGPQLSAARIQAASAGVTGTFRIPVILGLYSGASAPFPSSAYQSRLFGDVPGAYSVKTFYQEMSRGAFTMDGTVTAWVQLPDSAAYYEPNDSTDSRYGRVGEFLHDALDGADPTVDFGQFDNDGPDGVPNSGDDDGYVDAAAFVYPAVGMSCGGPGIWPHRWVYRAHWGAPYTTNDTSVSGGHVKVDDYLIQPGLDCNGQSLMPIGTFSHEMGHALGLPDLYDTGEGDQVSEGIGEWGLMGSGNWRTQDSPAHMSAWSKDYLGWVSVQTLHASSTGVTLPPVYEAGEVLRFDVPNSTEYFLLEHREPVGSDLHLHAPGLLIYHVDQSVIDHGSFFNTVNAGSPHGVDIEEADGLDELDLGYSRGGNRGDAGDPFPGSTARTVFNDSTKPDSRANNGRPSGFSLRNIRLLGGTLTFDVRVDTTGTASVDSVIVAPASAFVLVGDSLQLSAEVRDSVGNALVGRIITWASADTTVVTVSATGLAKGVGAGGPVTITATSEGQHGSARVTTSSLVGDLDGDGKVTSVDALGVLSAAVGKTLPKGWNATTAGDTNCDGQITSLDALIILSKTVGKDVSAFCIGQSPRV